MRVLGIETSCDETAAAVVGRDAAGRPAIHSSIVLSQAGDHAAFGGVVPEIAARAHVEALDRVIAAALRDAGLAIGDIDAVSATGGPGLVGGLMVGMTTGKAIAAARSVPFLAVNHLEGHALTAVLTDGIPFPYLLLLVSGGHTQIVLVRDLGRYERWGTTIDDALGEAFDKTASLLSLGFPGGPAVEAAAARGDPRRIELPRPMIGQPNCNFSFSGLKTAVRMEASRREPVAEGDVADLCAAFQESVCASLADRIDRAFSRFRAEFPDASDPTLVVAGGVAANRRIRALLSERCAKEAWRLVAPPPKLCGDNAAMIAFAGMLRLERGERSASDVAPRSRWPLDEQADALIGSGRRGMKA